MKIFALALVVPRSRLVLRSTGGDEDWGPSDVESPAGDVESVIPDEAALLRLCAATSRGACASEFEKLDVDALCRSLEATDPGKPLIGKWRLAYSSEALYRSSPFFWGFSNLLKDTSSLVKPRNAKSPNFADAIYAVTDALPFYDVGFAYHTITPNSLVSQVELKVSLFDALLPPAKSIMTTTARTRPTPTGLELTLEKTEVKDSSLEALPGFGFIGDLAFPTESAFQRLAGLFRLADYAATVHLQAPYTSDTLRITRNDQGALFVHVREPNDL